MFLIDNLFSHWELILLKLAHFSQLRITKMQLGQILFDLLEFPLQVRLNIPTSFAYILYTVSGCH